MNCRSGSRAGAREHRACREDEEAGRASGIECRVPIDAFGVIDVAREFGASMGMPKAGSVHYANAWLPTRASGAGCAARAAGAEWRRPLRTSSIACCPKCRRGSGAVAAVPASISAGLRSNVGHATGAQVYGLSLIRLRARCRREGPRTEKATCNLHTPISAQTASVGASRARRTGTKGEDPLGPALLTNDYCDVRDRRIRAHGRDVLPDGNPQDGQCVRSGDLSATRVVAELLRTGPAADRDAKSFSARRRR